MNKTLRALYNGEIFPAKQYLPKDDEYADLRENYNQRYEELVKKLGSPLDKEFEQIMDTQLEILYHEFYEMFIEGFCLGAKIVIKVYESENKNANSYPLTPKTPYHIFLLYFHLRKIPIPSQAKLAIETCPSGRKSQPWRGGMAGSGYPKGGDIC